MVQWRSQGGACPYKKCDLPLEIRQMEKSNNWQSLTYDFEMENCKQVYCVV